MVSVSMACSICETSRISQPVSNILGRKAGKIDGRSGLGKKKHLPLKISLKNLPLKILSKNNLPRIKGGRRRRGPRSAPFERRSTSSRSRPRCSPDEPRSRASPCSVESDGSANTDAARVIAQWRPPSGGEEGDGCGELRAFHDELRLGRDASRTNQFETQHKVASHIKREKTARKTRVASCISSRRRYRSRSDHKVCSSSTKKRDQ